MYAIELLPFHFSSHPGGSQIMTSFFFFIFLKVHFVPQGISLHLPKTFGYMETLNVCLVFNGIQLS